MKSLILSFFAFAFIIFFLSLSIVARADSSLVAFYSFNENTGSTANDSSGNGNNGLISNAAWNSSGKYGSALSFNGSNSIVSVNDSSSLDLTNGMTLEAWVKPTTLSSWRTILLKEKSGSLAYALYANTDNNKPIVQVYGTSKLIGTTQLPVNTWIHIAATYDGTTLKLYIDGSLVSSKSTSITIPNTSNPFRIGGNTIWGEYFNGFIDEVKIYKYYMKAVTKIALAKK